MKHRFRACCGVTSRQSRSRGDVDKGKGDGINLLDSFNLIEKNVVEDNGESGILIKGRSNELIQTWSDG